MTDTYLYMTDFPLYFKKWIEAGGAHFGGIEPPKQQPIDPDPAPGQTDAMPDFHAPGSDQLPPTKKDRDYKKYMKKHMKKKRTKNLVNY